MTFVTLGTGTLNTGGTGRAEADSPGPCSRSPGEASQRLALSSRLPVSDAQTHPHLGTWWVLSTPCCRSQSLPAPRVRASPPELPPGGWMRPENTSFQRAPGEAPLQTGDHTGGPGGVTVTEAEVSGAHPRPSGLGAGWSPLHKQLVLSSHSPARPRPGPLLPHLPGGGGANPHGHAPGSGHSGPSEGSVSTPCSQALRPRGQSAVRHLGPCGGGGAGG